MRPNLIIVTGHQENVVTCNGRRRYPPICLNQGVFEFLIWSKVDSDRASNTVTRISRTSFLVYLNCALVQCLSNKKIVFKAAPLVAILQWRCSVNTYGYWCTRLGWWLYQWMGLLKSKETTSRFFFSTTVPVWTLKKKIHSISYHFVREGFAWDKWRTSYISTHDNKADLITKQLLP